MSKNELYFCLKLTESEHWIVNDMVQKFCDENGLILKYYRKCKLHHFPMYREVKVVGKNINIFKKWMKSVESTNLIDYIEKIPDYGRLRKKLEIDKKCAEFGF